MAESGKPLGRGRPKQRSDVSLAGSRALDRQGVVPLYFQLSAVLKEKVDTGAWKPGARFPTEREIAEEFGVSRTVIRAALDLLVGDGAIVRIKGSGAFVAPPRREVGIFGVVQAFLEPKDDLAITVVTARQELPDPTAMHFLQMENASTPITYVTAVMHAKEQPLSLIQSYAPTNLVPWLLPTAEALQAGTEAPRRDGLELGRTAVAIELTFFGHWGAPQLGASAGDPALMARLVQFGKPRGTKQERPLEFAYIICPSDSAQYTFELG